MTINPIEIINEFYKPGSKAHGIILHHGEDVATKAIAVAKRVTHLHPDLAFIEESALLHDIAIWMTDSPEIGCHGAHPYVVHGYLGRIILEEKGFPLHAMVCERHVGVGLTVDMIKANYLPLPLRDMVPVTIEEQIICYADKFFSKKSKSGTKEKPIEEVISEISRYGSDQVARFMSMAKLFGAL